jgi:predicted flap endonuclease-1-like 5' DNA nuclease
VSIILALVVALAAFAVGYYAGRSGQRVGSATATPPVPTPPAASRSEPPSRESPAPQTVPLAQVPPAPAADATIAERARIIRSYEAESAMLRRGYTTRDAAIGQLTELADERRDLFDDLATARAETARYRQLVLDLENDAPPPFFGVGAPDDLKLIVGVGPVLERMLQMLGVTNYRQIARWTERDIDEFDAKLHEFPGRIRRDGWVTQARELHQSKYGEAPPQRERR